MDLNYSPEDHGRYIRVITYEPQFAEKRPWYRHFLSSVEPFKGNSKENGKEWKKPKTFFSVFELMI